MCGIFALFNNLKYSNEIIKMLFLEGKSRGPEDSQFQYILDHNMYIGFHRLAINGYQDEKANQPFQINNICLICNGEIYNHKKLYEYLGITPKSRSDCEVILHCYEKFGIEYTLKLLDGVFAFILIDFNKNKIFAARDLFGVRPMFMNTFIQIDKDKTNIGYALASELKSIEGFDSFTNDVKQVKPGSLITFSINGEQVALESQKQINQIQDFCHFSKEKDNNEILKSVYTHLEDAVIKRVENTDREIACLLSGGLDSSLIAALVKKHYKGELHTWSIGMEGSEDLKYAQMVADHIDSVHHSIVVSEEELLDAIPYVIRTIESYDTTTVRASVGNWLICKYIKEYSNAKVIFNGDGADEVMGGYMYFYMAPTSLDFDKECVRLLEDICYFDVLRSDRSISSHGLEARTPFLDRAFVSNYLSISPDIRHYAKNGQCEKYIMRAAVEKYDNYLLPKEVLWRTKEAFSDGVSKKTKSWFEIIQDHIKNKEYNHINEKIQKNILNKMNPYGFNKPKTLEQMYYRDIFCKYYKSASCQKSIPYFWMPRFVNASDASARTLNIYKMVNKIQDDNKTPTNELVYEVDYN
jgi:asparagine synthase (glutamine-hydrolysing)